MMIGSKDQRVDSTSHRRWIHQDFLELVLLPVRALPQQLLPLVKQLGASLVVQRYVTSWDDGYICVVSMLVV